MAFANQIVGLIRFSFATLGNFYPGFDTIEAMEAFLYDPERLERRFAWFEGLCLPSLVAQSDPDFTMILLVGANMPAAYRSRLRASVRALPAARVIEAPPAWHYAGIKAAFAEVPATGFTHRTTFRFDDDDALDRGFVARLREVAPRVMALGDAETPAAISFNLGFHLARRKGTAALHATCERMPISVGAAVIAPAGHPDNVYRWNHRQLPQFLNTFIETRSWSYIRTIHRDNKSDPKRTGETLDLPDARIDAILREHFGFDRARLLSLPIPD